MKRLEIHISYNCQNDCLFCSEKKRLQRFHDFKISDKEIVELLKVKRAEGFDHVNFTGGEPTLYHNFADLLKQTKALGYKIYIGSNGLFWANKNNCTELLPLIDEVSLSLHGSTAEIHNMQTRNGEGFPKIIRAFANIDECISRRDKPYFFCNIVVTTQNFTDIGNILKLVSKFKFLKQVLISNLAPEGNAYQHYKKLAVQLSVFKKRIPDWIEFANTNNLIIRFFGLPLCILGENNVYSNDLIWEDRLTYELSENKGKIGLKAKPTTFDRKREKIQICSSCLYNKLCGGIFSKYLKEFGAGEIVNFSHYEKK